MGSTSFLGFSCPNLLVVFLNLLFSPLFLGTCIIFFRKCWDFLWVLLFFSVPYFGLGRLLCIRKTYTKMDQIRFFFRDQKHEQRLSYAYDFGLLCFRQTRTGLPMRVRYSNEIAEWKWPPIFQNKRVRYARKSRRAGPLPRKFVSLP